MTVKFIDFTPMNHRTLVYAYTKLVLARDILSGVSGGATGVDHSRHMWQAVNLAAKQIMRRLNRIEGADGYDEAGSRYDEIRSTATEVANATAIKKALAIAPAGWVPIEDATAWEVDAEAAWTDAHRRLEIASDALVAVMNTYLPDGA